MALLDADYDRLVGTAFGHAGFKTANVMVTYAGDPTNNLTPEFVGQQCHDTDNDNIYIAVGTAAADWKSMTS